MPVPYKTEGSSGLLVRDDIAFSSAWHANMSGSPAPEVRLPGLQIRGRNLHSSSDRGAGGVSGNASGSMRDPRRGRMQNVDAGALAGIVRRKGRVEQKWRRRPKPLQK